MCYNGSLTTLPSAERRPLVSSLASSSPCSLAHQVDKYGETKHIPKYTWYLHLASDLLKFVVGFVFFFCLNISATKKGLLLCVPYQFINPRKPVNAPNRWLHNKTLREFARCFDNKKQMGCCDPPHNYDSIPSHVEYWICFNTHSLSLDEIHGLNLYLGPSSLSQITLLSYSPWDVLNPSPIKHR